MGIANIQIFLAEKSAPKGFPKFEKVSLPTAVIQVLSIVSKNMMKYNEIEPNNVK